MAKTKFDHRFSRRRRFEEVEDPETGEVKLELVWYRGKRPEKKPRYKTLRFPTKRELVEDANRSEEFSFETDSNFIDRLVIDKCN